MVKFFSRETVDKSAGYGNSAGWRKGEPGALGSGAEPRWLVAHGRDQANMVNNPAHPRTATQAVRSGLGPHRYQRSSVPSRSGSPAAARLAKADRSRRHSQG